MDVYRSRHKPRPGAISRHVRLSLLPEEWEVYEKTAAALEEGMAYTLTKLLARSAQRELAYQRAESAKLEPDPVTGGWIGRDRAIGEQV